MKIIKYLRFSFPFLITIALWRLSCPWINPAGLLSIIPIFYCSFIRPVPYFSLFALIMCFLLDYKFGTVFMWTMYYCMCYAIIKLQTIVDLTHTKKFGFYAFSVFLCPVLIFMIVQNINLKTLLYSFIAFAITCIMYIPTVTITRTIQND
ncbi:MAG: hypothetical protein J6Y07_04435 [Alphaproteobacteria bacterium]|nr:hypothetical protein [Alphaproteobacteria bacterium]